MMPERIKIDANSWHCKLYNKTWDAEPENLCAYVRGVFTSALLLTLSLVAILAICAMLVLGGWLLYENFKEEGWKMFVAPLVIVGSVISILLVIIGVLWIHQDGSYFFEDVKEKIGKNKRVSLIYEWLKAKKEKYCPLVEIDHNKKDKQA